MRWFDSAMPARRRCSGGVRCLIIAFLWSANVYAEPAWKNVADGIQYKKVVVDKKVTTEKSFPPDLIHMLQIDTLKYKLGVITAKQFGMTNTDVKTMAGMAGALIVMNGGYFTPEYDSLGLLVQNGQVLNKLKWTNWWHVFQMNNYKPMIVTKQDWKLAKEIEMAIEAGPRLIVDGNIQGGLKPGIAERSAIGITTDGRVIIAATEGYQVSLSEFAQALRDNDCYNALNLDGGGSTQLYAKMKRFGLNRPGFSFIANGIGVFPR